MPPPTKPRSPKSACSPVTRPQPDAAQAVLDGGEFKAESCETLLLHSPAGLKAKRLLIVGLGKAAKLTPHEVRKGAGAAVRFAKPRGLREVAIVCPSVLTALIRN